MIRMTTAILTATLMAMVTGSVAAAGDRGGTYNQPSASYDSDRGTRGDDRDRRADEAERGRRAEDAVRGRRSGSAGDVDRGYSEKGYAIVESVDRVAKTFWLRGNLYHLTDATEFLNDVGQRASMREVEEQTVINGQRDPDTGTAVYFESDRDHRLLKLHLLEAMPS